MRSGISRVVVCVNMLGEGFDLPQLKIAAVHDTHKAWLQENAQAIEAYNRWVEEHGAFGDAFRAFYSFDPNPSPVNNPET